MKQILSRALLLLLVIGAIFGLSSCKVFVEPEPSVYDLVVNEFERNVVYGSELDISGLAVTVTTGEKVEYIPVTDKMVTGADTRTIGEHELTIEYMGLSWNLYYEVFYKVEHIVDGTVYDSQLVMSSDELYKVKDPKKQGYTFIGWESEIPETLTGNVRINAMFADVEVPNFTATYGDTLATLTLPEAKEGHWEWKDDLDTVVGNAGTRTFTVIYVPNNPAADRIELKSTVTVLPKRVDITIISDTYQYDRTEHSVVYEISDGLTEDEITLICFGTKSATVPGHYNYDIVVYNPNYDGHVAYAEDYSGKANGMLNIEMPVFSISVLLRDPADNTFKQNVTINYGDEFPEYTIDVRDENGNLVDASIWEFDAILNKPLILNAISHDISVHLEYVGEDGYDDLNCFDITYNSANLVINRIDLEGVVPVVINREEVYYGDLLSSLKFTPDPRGEWVWDYEAAGGDTVGNAASKNFVAKFIPNDPNYNELVAVIAIEVKKQKLHFEVDPASQVVDYDGNTHYLSYVVKDAKGNTMEGFVVTGNDGQSTVKVDNGNVIPWTVVLTIVDDNYQASESFSLLINRINPVTDFETPINVVWNPQLTLEDVALPDENYTWLESLDYKFTAAGTYHIKARYTPVDTKNYNIIEADMTIVVSHANTTISGVNSSYDNWTYDSEKKALLDIFKDLTCTGSDRTVEYRLNGESVTHLTEAGVYNITIVVVGTEQYAEATFDVVVTINRADAEIYTAGIKGWTYNEAANAPFSTSNYGTVIYEYKLVGEDDSAYTTVVPVNAGDYSLRARIEGGEGYSWNASAPVYSSFTIAKAVVELPEIESKPYTGETLVADVPHHDLYKVKDGGNLGGINANNYDVILVLNDASNYVWSNGAPTAETSVIFKIAQADNSIDPFDGGEWTYGDTVTHTGINAAFGKETVTIKYYIDLGNGTKGSEVSDVSVAGNYIVTAEIDDTTDYKGASRDVTFTVKKLQITVPTLEETRFEYTGSKVTATVVNPDTKYYDIVNDGGTGANTYYVHFDLKNNNYMWDDGDENGRKSLAYNIVKSLVTVETANIGDWTFGGDAVAPSATKDKTFGVIKYEYKLYGADDSTYTTTVPTAAGRYVLRAGIVDSTNYDSISKTTEFTIHKASAFIEGVRADREYTTVYNNRAAYTISNVSSSHNEANVSYAIKNAAGETVTEMKNAGTYNVVISLDETANYNAAESIEVTVVIGKFAVNVPELAVNESVYNGNEFEPEIKANVHSAYFTVAYPIDEHKNAGSYAVSFTLNDALNYEWNDDEFVGSIPYQIVKANASIAIGTNDYIVENNDGTYTLTLTYAGREFNLASLIAATRVGEASVVYSQSGVTNVSDSQIVTVSVADSTNYNGTSVDVNVVINPANINSANIHFGAPLTYTGSEQTQTISAVKLGDLDVTYTVSGTSDKATVAGSHSVTVIGTGNFTGEATASFTIAAKSIEGADVILGDSLIYTGFAQYQTVSDVTLAGFECVTYTVSGNEATYAIDANGNVVTYTLTVTGNGNFEGKVTKTFTVARRSIEGADVNLGAALTYTGAEQYQAVSSVMLGELAATYSVSRNAAIYAVDADGDAITYTLTVEGTGNFNGSTTADFYVARKSIADATVTLGTALTYNGEEQTQTVFAVSIAGYSNVTYEVSDNTATYAVDENGNTIPYALTVEGTGNFTGSVTKAFSVGKLELTKPQDNVQVKWTGEHLTSGLVDTEYYTVEDLGGIDEDDYVATLTITNLNCKWKGEEDTKLAIDINYSIVKEFNHWTIEPSISKDLWVFNEEAATVDKGVAEHGDVTYKFALEGTTDYVTELPTKPGKYYVVFTATKEGYKVLTKTIHFEIAKATLITPEFEDDTLDYANNSVPTLVLKENADIDKFTFTNNVEYSVGAYSIVFTINPEYVDYYKWATEDSEDLSVPYSIVRVKEEITDLEINGWTYLEYNKEANAPTANKKFTDSEIIFEYKLEIEDETKYTTTIPTAVGDYVVRARIEGGEGYNWDGAYATKTFSITKADASISIDTEGNDYLTKNEDGTYTLTLTYTGAEFDLKSLIAATRVGEADVEYSVSKVQNVADSCTLTISVANSANYNGTSVDVKVVITPADISGANVVLGTPLTYTGVEQYQAVASVTLGTLSVTFDVTNNAATYVVDENGEVITYTLTVNGTGNFKGTETATFQVLPKSIDGATVKLGAALTYNGGVQYQTISSVKIGDLDVTYTVSDDSDIAVENAGDYSITVKGTGNFTGYVTESFSVARLDIKNADVNLGLGKSPDYNGEYQTQSISSITINGITLTADDYSVADSSILSAKIVGDYNITVNGQGNFTGSVNVPWSIEILYLDMPYYDTTTKYTYDGITEHVFFSEESTFWVATGDLKGLEAGKYYVNIAIKEEHAEYCQWKENVSRRYEYTIDKGTNEFVGTLTMSGWTYEDTVIGTPIGITGAKFGFENIVYIYFDSEGNELNEVPTSTSDIGTYKVRAFIPGDGKNYEDIMTEVEFVIAPKEIDAPEINLNQDYVKGGDNYPTILGTTDVLVAGNHGDYTVTYEFTTPTDLITYYVTVRLNNSNYVWADTKVNALRNLSYTLKGENAKIEVTDEDGIINGWTYGEAPEDIIAHIKDQLGIQVSYSGGIVTEYQMNLLYFESNTDSSATGSTVVPTTAGTYYFKIVIAKDAEKFERTVSEAFYQFTITPKALVAPEGIITTTKPATYGDTLGSLIINSKIELNGKEITGTWTWVDGNNTSVGTVTTARTFKATFTPNDSTNYAPITNVDVTVEVLARSVTLINSNTITSRPYIANGYKLSDIFAFKFMDGETSVALTSGDYTVTITYDKTGEAVAAFTAIGSYTVTVALNNSNYELTNTNAEYKFSVTQAILTLDGAVANNTSKPYGGEYHDQTADFFKTGLALKDANGKTVEDININVELYLDEECTVPVETINDAKTYYVKYYIDANDNYTMTAVTRKIVVSPADIGEITWPTYASDEQYTYKTFVSKDNFTVTERDDGTFTISEPNYETNAGYATFTITFKPHSSNYAQKTYDYTVALKTVAKYSGKNYYSIKDALDVANLAGSGNVLVYPDTTGFVVIDTDTTVGVGVTLILLYGPGDSDYNTNGKATLDSTSNFADYAPETNRKNLVVIESGVKLTISGKLIIAGKLCASHNSHTHSGQTAGDYAELRLKEGTADDPTAVIINKNATANVYGFIMDDQLTNEYTSVEVYGNIRQPFVIFDFDGGTHLSKVGGDMGDHGVLPINEFNIRNVQTKLVLHYGSALYTDINIQVSGSTTTMENVEVISGNRLFSPNEGGHIEIRYNPYNRTDTSADREKMKVDMYGGGKIRSISITYSSVTMDTSVGYLPLSWLFDIALHDGEYKTDQAKIQIMWGSSLTIESGASLINNSSTKEFTIVVLDDYFDMVGHPGNFYESTMQSKPGKLIVNGTLVVDNLAGRVYSEADGASITINKSTSVQFYRIVREASSITSALDAYKKVAVTRSLVMNDHYSSDGNTAVVAGITPALGSAMVYYDGRWMHKNVTVTLNANNGGASSTVNMTFDLTSGNYVLTSQLPTPQYEGFTFDGWYLGDLKIEGNTVPADDIKENKVTLNARWKSDGYIIYVVDVDGSHNPVSIPAGLGFSMSKYDKNTGTASNALLAQDSYKTDTGKQYYLSHYELSDGTKVTSYSQFNGMDEGSYTIYAVWVVKYKIATITTSNATIKQVSKDQYYAPGVSVSVEVSFSQSNSKTFTVKGATSKNTLLSKSDAGTYSFTMPSENVDIDASSVSGSCITGDTLITLADGTQKRVDQLTGDELLLVWNLETGRYEASNIVFIDSEEETVYEIIHLYFSDGSEVQVISEHGFFDLDLAKYVYIDATNYSSYIGHRFVSEGDINSNTWNEVTLTNVVIEYKLEKAWSPVTFKQLCYYTNGILSMPGGIAGLFNIFEVDTDTMTYDAEKMHADIETYGLFTLDDFGGMIPEIAFEAFNGSWLKVAIGKGMLTWEDIAYLAERYVPLV